MTGRRLYELATDAIGKESLWARRQTQLPEAPVAWGILSAEERRIWNRAASRVPRRKAVSA